MSLPYDYARCPEPVRSQCSLPCARKQPGHDKYQTYSMFPGGADCHGFIEERKE
jgi:hypothetical protein